MARARKAKPPPLAPIVELLKEAGVEKGKLDLFVSRLSHEQIRAIQHAWENWRHGGQIEPVGHGWRTWVIKAGRGFGKTRAGAEWIKNAVRDVAEAKGADSESGGLRIALVAATIEEAERIMLRGRSGLLDVAAPWVDRWRPSERTLYFAGGTQATLFSGAHPDGLRGPEHHVAWCDELSKWEKARDTWDNLQLGMRLGERPRVLVTTTPGRATVLKQIIKADSTVTTEGRSHGNVHLPAAFIAAIEEQYAGTRLGRQEIDGELLSDVPGALWNVELLERQRVIAGATAFTRTVIGVDPPAGGGTCGIVACARSGDGQLHVLADHSIGGVTPEVWAAKVAAAAAAHGTDNVVAEDNQGGAMVTSVLNHGDRKLSVRAVHARLSKSDRAAPVSMRFEAGKAWLHGHFPELEAELCGLIAGGGYDGPGRSPDRADAMVWAMTDLIEERAEPRVRFI